MCAEESTISEVVTADFFFNCWYFEIPSDKPFLAHTKVRSLPCARLSIGNVLEFLCWKWKPYLRVVFRKARLIFVLYMRSLLLVESFNFRPSNQYILVRVIPSCLRFAKVCLCQVSLLSRCSPRYLTSRESCTLFV
jgi:hypothetical protein